MTAEQPIEEQFAAWYKANYGHIAATSSWVERARVSYMAGRESAAAQLVEKEREIADLTKKRDRLGEMVAEQGIAAHNATLRAEAAEQRLQEVQAWKESQLKVTPDWQKIGELLNIGLGQSVTENIIPAITDLRERLRQREAELEQRPKEAK